MTILVNPPNYHTHNCPDDVPDESCDNVINDDDSNTVTNELVNILFMHLNPLVSGLGTV